MSETLEQALARRIVKLSEALRWYAEQDNYASEYPGLNVIEKDRGERARKALEEGGE